ncbi:MAG: J domain-containing protein [Acidobacteriaceae bacterium]
MNLYDNIGVDKSATPEEIKRAYRKKAQQSHPDKGGDDADFMALQNAYDVLSDPVRRIRYDQTGDTGQGPTTESQALSYIAMLLPKILDSVSDLSRLPLIAKLKDTINADISRVKTDRQKGEAILSRRREALKRLSNGIMASMIEAEIGQIEAKIKAVDDQVRALARAIEIVSDHSYQCEAEAIITPMYFMQFGVFNQA